MNFYKPIFIENRKRIVASKFKLVRLGTISTKITKGETPLWKGDEYQEKGILFVKSENVLTGSLFLSKSVFIDDDVHQRMKRSQLKKGDVLLNIVGASIGRSCVYDRSEAANINQAVCLIRPSKDVNPHWLCTVLNSEPFQTVLDQIKSGGARDNIDLYQVRALKVPFSPPDIQNHIVEIMQSAYAQKKQKEQEADALLDSIDDYVLAELGIEMPAVEKKKCFVVYANEIAGRRVDSSYYQSKFRIIDQIVESAQSDVFNLGVLISDISTGVTPKVDEDYYTDSSGIPFLRVQNVTNQGIDLNDAKFIKREVHEEMLLRSQLKKDDLVFTITGRIGSVAVVPDNFEGNINQHSVRFHLKAQIANININPHYVAVFFNSELGRSLSIREVTGGTRPALDYKALKSLKVILPPIEVQNEIVAEVKKRLTKAQETQTRSRCHYGSGEKGSRAGSVGRGIGLIY